MTIDPLFLNETSSIAYPEHFYPGEIEVTHHQLRNFISTVYHGKIFYVNKHDIYILDLDTRQRSLLVTVEFEARCLAAAYGWVCVGGEAKGDCAFIHIGEKDGQPGDFCNDLDVKMLGKEIVNAMNIQVLKPDPSDVHAREEIVVLISNNDHTVTVYSLSQRVVLTTIDHPQPMNYAALSPDSTIMAAVGDENKVYFLKRSLVRNASVTKPDTLYFPEYEWCPLADPDIPRGILQPEDFSFAIAFSPDGSLCAVSSQGGAITVFDMDAILDGFEPAEDAITCTFRSSRESLWGCVRSMAFSPSPWNLLAWAEDHGRIGLADVRQGFQRRQHLHLSKEKCKSIDIEDSTPSDLKFLGHKERMRRQYQQRMQALRGHPPVGARSLSDERDLTNTTSALIPRVADDLSERERSMNQALEAVLDESARRPYSVNYVSSHPETRPSAANIDLRREYEVQLLNPSSRFVPSHIPRRRPSVVLSDSQSSQRLVVDESSRMTMTASPGPISDDGMPPPMSTNDLTPASGASSSQPLPYNIPPSDPWHVIEANLASRRNDSGPSSRLPIGLQQLENAIFLERQLAVHMDRQLSDEQRLSGMLRSALDVRERLEQLRQLELRQQEPRPDQPHSGRHSPRIERILARQLSSDLDECQIRLERLADMIRNMPRRVNQLMDERDTLLQQHRNPNIHDRSSLASARSSALPTILTRADSAEMEQRMQRVEDERQLLMQQIEEMEREVRRAESNIELASFPSEVSQSETRDRPRTRANDRDGRSLLMTRLLSAAQSSSTTSSSGSGTSSDPLRTLNSFGDFSMLSSTTRRIRQRISTDLSPNSNRSTMPRTSEPPSRVTPADIHAARLSLQRSSIDVNGNWRRTTNTLQGHAVSSSTAIAEILREGGIGTAGIGWSPDGLKL